MKNLLPKVGNNSYLKEGCPYGQKLKIHAENWAEAPFVKLLCGFTWFVVDKMFFIFKNFRNKSVVCHVDNGTLSK